MIIKSIEPVADLDLSNIIFFTTQKVVHLSDPLNIETQQNLVIARYSDGTSYVIHNFGRKKTVAEKAKKALNSLIAHVTECGKNPTPTY